MQTRYILLALCIGLNWQTLFAQRYDNNWAYGTEYFITQDTSTSGNGQVYFTQDSFKVIPKPQGMIFGGIAASFSDAEGNMQLHTNNMWIMDTSRTKIENGDSINYGLAWEHWEGPAVSGFNAYNIWHSAVFVPHPDAKDTVIDMFHINNYPGNGDWDATICRTVIKKRTNGSFYVLSKNKVIGQRAKPIYGLMAVCKHGNGRDWWIGFVKDTSVGCIDLYLQTPDTLLFWGEHCDGTGIPRTGGGRMLFSQDGSRLVYCEGGTGNRIFDFDRCNGILSNLRTMKPVKIYDSGGSLYEFHMDAALSPNGRFLYYNTTNHLYQCDLNDANIDSNYVLIDTTDNFIDTVYATSSYPMGWSGSQIGPDGIIHLTNLNRYRYSSPVLKPDLKGDSCKFVLRGEVLPKFWSIATTNIPNYRLGRLSPSPCDTLYSDIKPIYNQAPWLKIFPNPATDEVQVDYNWIEWERVNELRLTICDVRGVTVMQEEIPKYTTRQQMSVKGLAAGVYTVSLRSGAAFVGGGSPFGGQGAAIAVCKLTVVGR